MADPFKKVTPGERVVLRAEAYNAFMDAANQVRNNRHNTATDAGNKISEQMIRIRNNTGSALPRFAVVRIQNPIVTPTANLAEFKAKINFQGGLPTTATNQRYAILQVPLAPGAIGKAVMTGLTVAKINVSNADHAFAVPVNAQPEYLASATNGSAYIIWRESGTGLKWAVVLLQGHMQGQFSLTVGEADGDPWYTGTQVIRFNQAVGFVVSRPPGDPHSDTQVYVSYNAASHSGPGHVTAPQYGDPPQQLGKGRKAIDELALPLYTGQYEHVISSESINPRISVRSGRSSSTSDSYMYVMLFGTNGFYDATPQIGYLGDFFSFWANRERSIDLFNNNVRVRAHGWSSLIVGRPDGITNGCVIHDGKYGHFDGTDYTFGATGTLRGIVFQGGLGMMLAPDVSGFNGTVP